MIEFVMATQQKEAKSVFGWAFLGCGNIAAQVADEMIGEREMKIVSCWNRTLPRAEAFAEKYGSRAFASAEQAIAALKAAEVRYGELADYLALTPSERLRHVLLPGAAPQTLTGLRLGFGYAWRALVGAELIAASSGLGYLIEDAGALMHTDVVMVGILTIALLGVGLDALYKRLIERLVPWARTEERK